MRLIFAGLLLAALFGPAQAEDTPIGTPDAAKPAPPLIPQHLGYAVEQPQILVRQRLFGLAHGLSVLAAACLDLPEHAQAVQDAYAAWHARQRKTIEALVHDLARYYFGPRARDARWQDLARALNLNDSIEPALGAVSLEDACASLPAAIRQPRYELDRLLAEAAEPETGTQGNAAAPPAPTVRRPAE